MGRPIPGNDIADPVGAIFMVVAGWSSGYRHEHHAHDTERTPIPPRFLFARRGHYLDAVNAAVFPSWQGRLQIHQIAALTVALLGASQQAFVDFSGTHEESWPVANAKTLARPHVVVVNETGKYAVASFQQKQLRWPLQA